MDSFRFWWSRQMFHAQKGNVFVWEIWKLIISHFLVLAPTPRVYHFPFSNGPWSNANTGVLEKEDDVREAVTKSLSGESVLIWRIDVGGWRREAAKDVLGYARKLGSKVRISGNHPSFNRIILPTYRLGCLPCPGCQIFHQDDDSFLPSFATGILGGGTTQAITTLR